MRQTRARLHSAAQERELQVKQAGNLSLAVNVLLFVVKAYAMVTTHSLAVVGSFIDSLVDCLAQIIIVWSSASISQRDKALYPAGKAKLEPISIVVCCVLMTMAALQLVIVSTQDLYQGMHNDVHTSVEFDALTIGLLVAAIGTKVLLYLYCVALSSESPTVDALAVDHRNDVLSNLIAIATGYAAYHSASLWYWDPTGAILISVYIAFNWGLVAQEQIHYLVGKSSSQEFLDSIVAVGNSFHEKMKVDIARAYHFGPRFLVELEVIHPAEMRVRESHDIALALQKQIELNENVERAFIHVDYMGREEDEHDWMAFQENAARQHKRELEFNFHLHQAEFHRQKAKDMDPELLTQKTPTTATTPLQLQYKAGNAQLRAESAV